MIVLSVHNSYQQAGGEDEVFRQEADLLEQHGHQVVRCQAHNNEVKGKGPIELLTKTIYNSEGYQRVRSIIRETRPAVMHVHNTFPLFSPAVYYAAKDEAVPVVQTLHNYRLLCPSGVLFRDGHVCESCLGKLSLAPGIAHACYRDSRPATAAAAAMLLLHRSLKTYKKLVGAYIALSEFARSKFIEAGLPTEKIFLKPNFVHPDPGVGDGTGGFCLFVGRLSREKGILPLLDAWTCSSPPLDLEIVGDGDLAPEVARAAQQQPRVRWHGRLQKSQVYERLKKASALILPSIWYESFPMTIVEAFAAGVPVIASNLGSMAGLIQHQRNGLHFSPGDSADLARQVAWFHENRDAARQMRKEARRDFEERYTGERNYVRMMEIYGHAMEDHILKSTETRRMSA